MFCCARGVIVVGVDVCCRKLVVHGFVVDEQGLKMSKSKGNVVDPQMVIHGSKVGPRGYTCSQGGASCGYII